MRSALFLPDVSRLCILFCNFTVRKELFIYSEIDKEFFPDNKVGSNTPKFFDSRCNLCLEEKIQIMLYQDPEKLSN